MPTIALRAETDWTGWRDATRTLVLAGVPPEAVRFTVDPSGFAPPPAAAGGFGLPRALVGLAAQAIQAHWPERFALLYRLVWRAHAGAPVLEDHADPDLVQARHLAHAVRAEAHRMRSQIRYLAVADRWVGWFAPRHFVLESNARRLASWFPDLAVSLLTPEASAHWDPTGLRFGPGVAAAAVPDDAALGAFWASFGAELLAVAGPGFGLEPAAAFDEPRHPPDIARPFPVVVPDSADPGLAAAAHDAAGCARCALAGHATQTVFGEGPAGARLMFIGEQAGDQEDVIGRPFVGPAGQLLDRALAEAGIDRRAIWISNMVKHFKFTMQGKRRLHQTPQAPELEACRFWLDVERVQLRPALLVLLGATAARAMLGRAITIGRERGRAIALADGATALVTVHPSFLLRVPDAAARAREYAAFVADLRAAARLAG